MAQLITTTAAAPKPILPLKRRYDDNRSIHRALTDIISALNTGGFVYQGQRQPAYPFPRLVTNFISLPPPGDATLGAVAFITDSQIPYNGFNIGTPAVGAGTYFAPVYNGIDANGNYNWLIG